MKVVAAMLLISCAPVATSAPASLPYVRIERTLSGPVCSREAAETIAILRSREREAAVKDMISCQGETKSAMAVAEQQTKRASVNAWWGTWGGVFLFLGVLTGLAAGFGGGFAAAK